MPIRVRRWWQTDNLSIVDVIAVLPDRDNPRRYWSDLKPKLTKEGSELYAEVVQLKLPAEDGKMRLTDVADTKQLFRLIQSISSPKTEPFKLFRYWNNCFYPGKKVIRTQIAA